MFQAAANFRQHVLDLISGAEHRGDSSDGLTPADRERARAELDERARTGRPFVFMGPANAIREFVDVKSVAVHAAPAPVAVAKGATE